MSLSPRSRLLVPLVALGILVAGCAGGAGSAGTLPPVPSSGEQSPAPSSIGPSVSPAVSPATPSGVPSPSPSGPAPSSSTVPTPTPSPTPGTTHLAIYLLSGETLVPVQREVPATVATARAAISALLAGPTVAEAGGPGRLGTTIPNGSRLLGISLAGGVATVDLTGDFQSGGGSLSMFGRLAQVTYTLTQFPTVQGVLLRLDGQPVTVFSSEGIVLSGPLTRDDYRSFLPAIFLERPTWGGQLANPARLTGLANVFEAQFSVEITTASGTVVGRANVTASCGTGCWGTFDVTVPYTVDRAQPGYVVVFDASARDGSRENVRSYPVQLAPAG